MNEPLTTMPLGIDGFTYADLYEPSRLRDLHEIFCARVAAEDPSLWAHWDAYRTAPDSVTSPIERSDLIVRMAPHLSRFVTALFRVDAAAGEIGENTRRLEPLFRFKIDFVRKRALPLVKGGAHVTLSPQDIAIVEELSQHWIHLDREQAIAMAGCELLDRETAARDKEGRISSNPLGIALPGCPLDEKISEMHMVRKSGDAIGALAIVVIDNPMCPGTGHRICNDCMKACIYQKQEPVNIPQIETGVLTDVLRMPWGVEIYQLLTRWNPLNIRRPYALPYNGRNVLVVGLGPAGYTLAHYLLNEGFGVVAIDGLKIEPLPSELTGEGQGTPSRRSGGQEGTPSRRSGGQEGTPSRGSGRQEGTP